MLIVFGYFKFHSEKQDSVNAILKNNNCVVLMSTDGGKIMYYAALGIILPRFTIVIKPVIALKLIQGPLLCLTVLAKNFL